MQPTKKTMRLISSVGPHVDNERGNLKQLSALFDNMDVWRHLPAYQLERRADIFFSIYLSDLLASKFGAQVASVLPGVRQK
jgi:hypothetical protein